MYSAVQRIFFPDLIVRFYIDAFESVPCHGVEFPYGIVVFRRVSGCNHDPAIRDPVSSEYLILQKLQHRRRQCFRHAVDLVKEQYAFTDAGLLHHVVNRCNDL